MERMTLSLYKNQKDHYRKVFSRKESKENPIFQNKKVIDELNAIFDNKEVVRKEANILNQILEKYLDNELRNISILVRDYHVWSMDLYNPKLDVIPEELKYFEELHHFRAASCLINKIENFDNNK